MATAINLIGDIVGTVLFTPDATHDIGAVASGRPRDIYFTGSLSGPSITPTGLTASLPVVTNASKALASLSYASFKTNLVLAQADISGLTTASSPYFVTVKLSGLTDGYVPYHVSDASGLANSVIYQSGGKVTIGGTGGRGTLDIADGVVAAGPYSWIGVYLGPSPVLASAGNARCFQIDGTATATANNDKLIAAYVGGSLSPGAYSGVTRYGLYQTDGAYNNYFAGKVGFNTLSPAAVASINGGLHVGGDSDPGDNNLLVDGTANFSTGISVGGATPGTGGLAFPATAVAVADANTLDDYEESTWTPSITAGGTSTNGGGAYTKIGRVVTFTGWLVTTALTGTTTDLVISGLPFTPAARSGAFCPSHFGNAANPTLDYPMINTDSTIVMRTQAYSGAGATLYFGGLYYV